MRARWGLSVLAIASAVAFGMWAEGQARPGRRRREDAREVRPRDGRRRQAGSGCRGCAGAHQAGGAGKVSLAGRAHADLRRRRSAAALDPLRAGGAARGRRPWMALAWRRWSSGSLETDRLHVMLGSPGRWVTPDQAYRWSRSDELVRGASTSRSAAPTRPTRSAWRPSSTTRARQRTRDSELRRAAARAARAGDQMAIRVRHRPHGRRRAAGLEIETKKVEARSGNDALATAMVPAEPDRVRDVRTDEGDVGQTPGRRDLTGRDIDRF